MSSSPRLIASLLGLLSLLGPAIAAAAVVEPDGRQVPVDPTDPNSPGYDPSYTEIPLKQFFAMQGETFDWLKDAATQPAVFSPLCDFTAKFVLNQAGNHFGLAWYNAAGQAPQANDLHTIVPANSPVGTTINSANIKNDPNYKGGLIGFALIGGQTHYSEQPWNLSCSGCATPGPWALALVYPSTKMPNAYYVAFEDGNVTSFSFNNDGDFNDDVFLVSGVACSGAGQPCDTGQKGVCADGLTGCDATGASTCKPLNKPQGETCNGLDDDCNGMYDDGAMCPNGQVCDRGKCVDPCGATEFQCTSGLVCDNKVCVDMACVGVKCPTGQVCSLGQCKGPCDGVQCPFGQVCRAGRCADPCAGVTCAMNEVCSRGVCVVSCACLPCPTGKACAPGGQCLDPGCIGKACPMGQHCSAGNCEDDCKSAVCPTNQACEMSQCVDLPPPPDMAGEADLVMASFDWDASATDEGPPDLTNGLATRPKGCSCNLGDSSVNGGAAIYTAMALLVGLGWRSRRRRGQRR